MFKFSRREFALAGLFASWATGLAQAQLPPSSDTLLTDHPSLNEALQHVRARRWSRLSSTVRGLPPQSAAVLIDYLGDLTTTDISLDGLDRESLGSTITGGLLVNWAWRFRGTGMISTVTREGFNAFQQHLIVAKSQLQSALAHDVNDGVAAAFLIRVEKGLQNLQAVDEAFHRFEAATTRPIGGYAGYADAISGKWYGSQQRMLGFARQHKASMPPNSQALIAQAHTESSLALTGDADHPDAAANYMRSDFVRAEITAANEAFHAVALDSDAFANRFAFGAFSFAFVRMGELDLARPHVAGMGAVPAGPWALLPRSRALLQQLRQQLGLAEL